MCPNTRPVRRHVQSSLKLIGVSSFYEALHAPEVTTEHILECSRTSRRLGKNSILKFRSEDHRTLQTNCGTYDLDAGRELIKKQMLFFSLKNNLFLAVVLMQNCQILTTKHMAIILDKVFPQKKITITQHGVTVSSSAIVVELHTALIGHNINKI